MLPLLLRVSLDRGLVPKHYYRQQVRAIGERESAGDGRGSVPWLPEEPNEGAQLIFDGEEFGIIGSEAYIDVVLPNRPERVSVEAHGWEIEASTQVTENGLFDDTFWSNIRLQMHRTDP